MKRTTLALGTRRHPALTAGDGPLALVLHGFPDHPRSFESLLRALADAGFRAVAPTMRGYTPSALPADRDFHVASLAEDVVGFIDAAGADEAVVIGHDWGAVASWAACALAPDRVSAHVAMAIPHLRRLPEALRQVPEQLLRSWYIAFFQLPWLAERAVARRDFALIEQLWRAWSPGLDPAPYLAPVRAALTHSGVRRAALGYYRALRDTSTAAGRRSWRLLRAPVHVPTLAITGSRDGCIDTRLFDRIRQEDVPAGLVVERIADAGHFMHLERPERVERTIVTWLAERR